MSFSHKKKYNARTNMLRIASSSFFSCLFSLLLYRSSRAEVAVCGWWNVQIQGLSSCVVLNLNGKVCRTVVLTKVRKQGLVAFEDPSV